MAKDNMTVGDLRAELADLEDNILIATDCCTGGLHLMRLGTYTAQKMRVHPGPGSKKRVLILWPDTNTTVST